MGLKMKLLLFSGSLRAGSLNKKLLLATRELLRQMPACETSLADLKALNLPLYDGDIEAQAMPNGVIQLGQLVSEAHALIIASPEYNASIAAPLKNTIDWLSRLRPVPLQSKPILMMGASPGAFGAIRA